MLQWSEGNWGRGVKECCSGVKECCSGVKECCSGVKESGGVE